MRIDTDISLIMPTQYYCAVAVLAVGKYLVYIRSMVNDDIQWLGGGGISCTTADRYTTGSLLDTPAVRCDLRVYQILICAIDVEGYYYYCVIDHTANYKHAAQLYGQY